MNQISNNHNILITSIILIWKKLQIKMVEKFLFKVGIIPPLQGSIAHDKLVNYYWLNLNFKLK